MWIGGEWRLIAQRALQGTSAREEVSRRLMLRGTSHCPGRDELTAYVRERRVDSSISVGRCLAEFRKVKDLCGSSAKNRRAVAPLQGGWITIPESLTIQMAKEDRDM